MRLKDEEFVVCFPYRQLSDQKHGKDSLCKGVAQQR